ncbi:MULTISPECIES: adenine phosphoribosyltransferase [Actinomyces]|uniref:Adenine phosphoribosyltransferase n=1 Tax=Actinomyces glycerinitolerans TaxID=1892869 RepID=A0A1M4S1C5_9ACTO|nr:MULTISPECIES: adenine phosphoribosyltransferase [Actinomyces]RAX21093.1 adenine phosphoribosyltransferase [Actinomyces sp. Z5]RAX23300.1 adenine phosphoribosyltransferase [Actinomyces sp. Z3]SHE26044.1 adenine phosphoribosyl transferase [Actinomyces glycerinitolerans]
MTISPALPKELTQLVLDNLREIPDFPEPGVLFRDITPLLSNGEAFANLIDGLAAHYRGHIDAVAGLESRGFILAAPLAVHLGIGMVIVRKAGKLPGPVLGVDYELEYGTARMELRPETVEEGSRVLVIDDVLATGGTAAASIDLLEQAGAKVESICMLLELAGLGGREKLAGRDIDSVVVFESA